MSFILLLLFLAVIFRTGRGMFGILLSIVAFLFVISLVAHLWWIILLIIPFTMFSSRRRTHQYANTKIRKNHHQDSVDGEYDEVDE